MTIRSYIRPKVLVCVDTIGWAITLFVFLIMLTVVMISLSFFWIPLAFWLWFNEKPVLQGIVDWLIHDVLNPKIPFRGFP